MHSMEWIPQRSRWLKEARDKENILYNSSYEVQEQSKLIHGQHIEYLQACGPQRGPKCVNC